MRHTKVSCNSQFYAKHQTIYTLRDNKSHMSKLYNHKGKSHVADKPNMADYYKNMFFHRGI